MVLQRQHAEPLAAHAERPIGQPALVHRAGRLAAERLDHRNLVADRVRVLGTSRYSIRSGTSGAAGRP